jgi:hypothetical protein
MFGIDLAASRDPMTPELNSFMHALMGKALATIFLAGLGALLLRELLQ